MNDCYTTVWRCNNFYYRWQFLIHGMIVMELYNTPPPIGLRLDTEALGFQLE